MNAHYSAQRGLQTTPTSEGSCPSWHCKQPSCVILPCCHSPAEAAHPPGRAGPGLPVPPRLLPRLLLHLPSLRLSAGSLSSMCRLRRPLLRLLPRLPPRLLHLGRRKRLQDGIFYRKVVSAGGVCARLLLQLPSLQQRPAVPGGGGGIVLCLCGLLCIAACCPQVQTLQVTGKRAWVRACSRRGTVPYLLAAMAAA